MYDVHPYSMYRFLQLILDGTPTTHPGRRETQGEEEKTIQANTFRQNNDISISFRSGFGPKNGFPKLTGL